MKTLILVRHAKSSWDETRLPDRDRLLAEGGERELVKMGRRLAARDLRVDLIISSPALRALATAVGLARALGYRRKDIVFDERLYACRVEDLLAVLEAEGEGYKRVMLVGHNPEFLALLQHFCPDIEHLPTCAVAELRFDCKSWVGLGKLEPEKLQLDYPKKNSKGKKARKDGKTRNSKKGKKTRKGK